jgi:hypothetical protein
VAAVRAVGALLGWLAIPTAAQQKKTEPGAITKPLFTPAQLAERTVHRRPVEAVICGMSAVNTNLMRQEMFRKTGGRENQVLYWSRPADANNQTLTARRTPFDKGRVSLKTFGHEDEMPR